MLSHEHGLLVRKLADALKERYRQSFYKTRHQAHIVAMLNIVSESHLIK